MLDKIRRILRVQTYARILPVNVDSIQAVCVDEIGNVLGKSLTVGRGGPVAEDLIRSRVGREGPATKRQNLFYALEALELLELKPREIVAHFNLEILGDGPEGEVDMGVLFGVDLAGVHVEAVTSEVESLEVTHSPERIRCRADLDVRPAVGDAPVRSGLGSSGGSKAGVRAELGRGATLAPDVAACVERTLV